MKYASDDWNTDALIDVIPDLKSLAKENSIDMPPYGKLECLTYGLAAEGLKWAAQRIKELQADNKRLRKKKVL